MNVMNQMISVLTPKHIVTIRLVLLCVFVVMGILEMELFAKVSEQFTLYFSLIYYFVLFCFLVLVFSFFDSFLHFCIFLSFSRLLVYPKYFNIKFCCRKFTFSILLSYIFVCQTKKPAARYCNQVQE